MDDLLRNVRGNDHRLLLGVTGTIASGKTSVAEMLAHCGAYSIDFDILARQVVMPGEPAYEHIVNYFGKEILQADHTLDRQKLSSIVFKNIEKRKKLEQFTHPQILNVFIRQLEQITQKDPYAIVQVIVPLMIEQNLQYLFHKLLVVYAPQEELVKRLMKRNVIPEEDALRMINSQISIDEKLRYADFVIDNGSDLTHTQIQVDELWKTLVRTHD
ncbi:MAG: dephospho-CoA kinase [Candidatus Magnetomorum sp.]|nr:dephospho-CoA kinase [Candidatus Magnetomorum sp.]